MALEIEIKFLGQNHATLRKRLQELGAFSEKKHLERNLVFDDCDGALRDSRKLLRLRKQVWHDGTERSVLTFKKPVAPALQNSSTTSKPLAMKVREEHEISFKEYDAALAISKGLGYAPIFGYDKMREEWRFSIEHDASFEVHVALDSLVFGDVVEIEGSEEAIMLAAKLLYIDTSQNTTASYHALNAEWRIKCGMPMQDDFTFDVKIIDDFYNSLPKAL